MEEHNQETIEKVIQALKHSDPQTRESGIQAVWRLRDQRLVQPLLARLDDACARLRAHAAITLSMLGAQVAAQKLLAHLGDDSDEVVRGTCAAALGFMKVATAYKGLVQALRDPSDKVALAACRALADLGDQRAVKPLQGVLFNHPSWQVRYFAWRALFELDWRDKALLEAATTLRQNSEELADARRHEQSLKDMGEATVSFDEAIERVRRDLRSCDTSSDD